MGLIRAHPDLYIKNVISGWWMFWWAAVYWSVDALAVPALIPALRVLIFIERGIMVMVNFTFIIGSLAAVFWKKIRVILAMNPILWLGLTAIWATSLAQALLDHGDNPRYLVPMQSMVMLIVMWWLYMLLRVKLWNNPKKHIRDNFPREHRDGVC
jgi:hypothetical protein